MEKHLVRLQLEDFRQFCAGLDVKSIVAAADRHGRAPGYEKELYALAIMSAARTGAFGDDAGSTQEAISALWDRGYRSGFNTDSFNTVFEEYFSCW